MEINEEILLAMERCSHLIVAAIIKKTRPYEDDITEHQARLRYDRKWLKKMKAWGYIHSHYVGNRIIYSIFEIECAKVAADDHTAAFLKVLHGGKEE